jgi:hypothetical protein
MKDLQLGGNSRLEVISSKGETILDNLKTNGKAMGKSRVKATLLMEICLTVIKS